MNAAQVALRWYINLIRPYMTNLRATTVQIVLDDSYSDLVFEYYTKDKSAASAKEKLKELLDSAIMSHY